MHRFVPGRFRFVTLVCAAVLVVAGSVAAGAAVLRPAPGPDHARLAAPPGAGAHAQPVDSTRTHGARSPSEFEQTANPISLDPPVSVPSTTPVTVTIADNVPFGNNPPPAVSTVTLPKGPFAEVVLSVTGTETGRQFDRLCEVFDGPSQIFLGVTPEPTPQGITWHAEKNITGYLPLLTGTRTFSTYVDNFLSSVDTGIPTITAQLLFYPAGGGFRPTHTAHGPSAAGLAGDAINETGPSAPVTDPIVPSEVVPLVASGASNTLNTIGAGQTISTTVTLPDNVTSATLDLYAIGQSTDEFWWSLEPAFREVEVSIDGQPAGVVWPFPYVYTGGVNPLIWRPLTGIHTLDIPSYRLDLTPFAGMLGGTHTITLTVAGNAGYWLAGGSLLLSTGDQPTTGQIVSDTLAFPTTSTITTSDALGSSNQPVTSESANASYVISGTVGAAGGPAWTDSLSQSLQFGNDQSYINPSCSGPCYQWVHAEVTQSTTETLAGPDGTGSHGSPATSRKDNSTWTIDAPNGFLQNSDGSDFFLPATVDQELTDSASQSGGMTRAYATLLMENITGYGALEEDNSVPTITNGDTTGTISYRTSGEDSGLYQRSVVTRGGQILQDLSG